MIRKFHGGLLVDEIEVPLAKLYAWLIVPRRTVYFKPIKATPQADLRFARAD
jgi:putative transposase